VIDYRPEIDGLRSLAVIPVVLFHAGITGFSGGFVGVDVFFVISGYLIASIIISEMKAGSFTYLGFYERRIRRILPALMTVVLFSIIAGLIFGLPNQVEQTAWSSVFSMLGVSNIYFWTQSGYFAPASEYQMLLHTWSLGVEEQFYLFLPPLLFFIFKFGPNLRIVFAIALSLLSIIGAWLSFNKPSAAFFLLPARAWELALGVALAAGIFPRLNSSHGNSTIALVGLSALIASFFVIDKQMAFPGYVALLPCLGTAAIIYSASSGNFVGRLLAIRPLRFIGLISYSLYLWHWPVFVSLRMFAAAPHLSLSLAIVGTLLSVLLAYLTWRFIENPFRAPVKMSIGRVFLAVGTAALAAISIASISLMNGGFPSRLSPTAQQFFSAAQDIDPMRIRCQGIREIGDQECWFGDLSVAPSFVVIGDSHAGAIRPAIEQWAISAGRAGTILWRGGCPFILGATKVPDADRAECTNFKDDALEAIVSNLEIELVISAGRWEVAYSGVAPEVGGSFRTFWIDDIETGRTPEITNRVFARGVSRTASTLAEAGRQVVFIGAVPELGFDVPTVLSLAAHNQGVTDSMYLTRDNSIAEQLDGIFERIASETGRVEYVSIWEQFCAPQCLLLADGVPLYSDDDHLTLTAAREVLGPFLTNELTEALTTNW
jgi:peptidoglycan/LPS O-acetylase OafA/YrhL